MSWSVICDFDGTIVAHDSADLIFEQFATPEWLTIEALWQAGEIGSAECMQRQVTLINTTLPKLNALLDTIVLDPDFPLFVQDCQSNNIPIIIVSDGLDYVIHYILRRFNLDTLPVFANQLVQIAPNQFALHCPYTSPDCKMQSGVCKCSVVKAKYYPKMLYIGDGRSDFCVTATVDLVLAKTSLLTYCQTHALPHLPYTNFAEIRTIMKKL